MRHLITLYPKPPYNFPLLLNFLMRFAHPTLNVVHEDALWRVVKATPPRKQGGEELQGLALLRISDKGGLDAPRLDVQVAISSGEVDDAVLVESIKHILPTEHDWST